MISAVAAWRSKEPMKTILRSRGMLVGVLLLLVMGASVRGTQFAAITAKRAPPRGGQTLSLKAFLAKYDLSHLWTTTDSSEIFGFIGAGYQRLQIHFLSVTKSQNNAGVYLVEGKTLVRNRVRRFRGEIVVESVAVFPSPSKEDDVWEKGLTEGTISGRYLFKQNPKQEATGVFKGKLKTYYYTDRHGPIHYDDIEAGADGYTNNDFVGIWKSYRGDRMEKCNWGDYRAPDSGDLDIGAGDFFPNDQYIKNGWQSFVAEQEEVGRTGGNVEKNKWWK